VTLWRASGVRVALGARTLFDGLDLVVGEGECVGLVGVNGSGKSTLLEIAAGIRAPDAGLLERRRGAAFGYLPQEPTFGAEVTLAEELFVPQGRLAEAHAAHEALSKELESAPAGAHEGLLRRLEEASSRIEQLGGWDTAHLAQAMLERLGVPASEWDKPLATLSGGTRKRVAIAKVLLQRPDLLLLDEPTNHLDVSTIDWLEHELDEFPGAILVVTHDRYFLDRLAERIVEIDQGQLVSYPGNFHDYLSQKVVREEEAARREHKRQRLIVQELAWLRRAPEARRTKRKSRVMEARKLIAQRAPEAAKAPEFQISAPRQSGHTLLELRRVRKSYGGPQLVDDFSLLVERGERLGVIGPNGAGKTTLVRMMLGEEPPDGGEVIRSKNARLAYFDQTRALLDPEQTVLEAASSSPVVEVNGRPVELRDYLCDLLFPVPMQKLKVQALSGGEKNRLLLARLFLSGANLLVLDEPTNDLDITTLEVLEEMLLGFPGSVILVTHDRYVLDKVATSILAFEGAGKVTRYPGNHEMYLRLRPPPTSARAPTAAARPVRPRPPAAPVSDKLRWADFRRLEEIESVIEAAEAERSRVEQALGDPELYRSRAGEVAGLRSELDRLGLEIERLYAEWQDLESRR